MTILLCVLTWLLCGFVSSYLVSFMEHADQSLADVILMSCLGLLTAFCSVLFWFNNTKIFNKIIFKGKAK